MKNENYKLENQFMTPELKKVLEVNKIFNLTDLRYYTETEMLNYLGHPNLDNEPDKIYPKQWNEMVRLMDKNGIRFKINIQNSWKMG